MKKLPESWCVKIEEHPYLEKFKEWHQNQREIPAKLAYTYDYYGRRGIEYACSYYPFGELLTLDQWHEIVFRDEFEQGEIVEVSEFENLWFIAEYVCKYKGLHVTYMDDTKEVCSWNYCRKVKSELDIKIDELKSLGESLGVKIEVICTQK